MSTIVVVRKNNQVCIAADSLTTFGDLRMGAAYDRDYNKIQSYKEGFFGIVGSAAHALVMESILADEKIEIDFSSRLGIFETFRSLHPILKENYFLNAKDEEDDPYEATHIDALICNAKGIFGVYSLREVSEYHKFWAIGSGSEFALGAMHVLYDRLDSAQDIAEAAVKAGCEFNTASGLPISYQVMELDE